MHSLVSHLLVFIIGFLLAELIYNKKDDINITKTTGSNTNIVTKEFENLK